ncbi:Dolichyl-diphosphooligosaccharide--protein glycotransferase [Zostera marina]|uniref:Dolichyl-diphosphooligosaccharide--protein glycosyltransferase subunit 2 n=1 Tax=Zostera marina TaxID=29655 RepID=A0A0K9PHM8_ZOSMR|nr:Dolichyl-diphosphooligosaccharide--protein glycotransferase [Zostera marina]
MMAGIHLLFVLLISIAVPITRVASVGPITDIYRSAAASLLVPKDNSFGSLEESYEALRTLEILGVEKNFDLAAVAHSTCHAVVEKLKVPSLDLKDVFFALNVNDVLGCKLHSHVLKDNASKLLKVIKDATSLLEFYYSIGSLVLIKKQGSHVVLPDVNGVFHSIKTLSQSDGRWRYDSNSAESSTQAAGLALKTLAGVLLLANDEVDQSMVGIVKNDIVKLFDSIKSYDDGSLYFDEIHTDVNKYQDPLSTTASVVQGLIAFSDASHGRINIEGDTVLGLAKFFLSIGIPGSSKDFFYQVESLSCFEKNSAFIPLVFSLPSSVLSSSTKDLLKVRVTTVLGSVAPSLTVILKQCLSSNSKRVLENQNLQFDPETSTYFLDIASKNIDIGKYSLNFEISLRDEHANVYVVESRIHTSIYYTGFVKIDDAEMSVLDADVETVDSVKKLDLMRENSLSFSANHLQKLLISFKLTTPSGKSFKPQQVFLKLIHETNVNHIFVLENSGKKFKKLFDFLGLVDKLYYLSGKYIIQLTIGDAVMENSFLQNLGHLELDLPEAPEKATHPPLQPVDPASRFGPQSEISHIFRIAEKLPPKEVSLVFLCITLLPLIGFAIGLVLLGVNLKNFPSSSLPLIFAILFHAGIAAVLLLYALFWLKLDLFTTLKYAGGLGVFLVVVGHVTLSHLASVTTKLKSS